MPHAESTPSVSVHVKLTVYPSYAEAFLAALKPTFVAVTSEPLNTFFEIYQLEREPGVFKLVENWNATAEYMMNVSSTSSCSIRVPVGVLMIGCAGLGTDAAQERLLQALLRHHRTDADEAP